MKADRSPGEARPAATSDETAHEKVERRYRYLKAQAEHEGSTDDDTVVFRMPEMDATLSDVPPRQPRRLRRRDVRKRWDGFSDAEVYCLFDIFRELDRWHQFGRGIEPERSLAAELERECRRRGLVGDE
jgi:hypothetical protein